MAHLFPVFKCSHKLLWSPPGRWEGRINLVGITLCHHSHWGNTCAHVCRDPLPVVCSHTLTRCCMHTQAIVIAIGSNHIVLLGGKHCVRSGFLEGDSEIEFLFQVIYREVFLGVEGKGSKEGKRKLSKKWSQLEIGFLGGGSGTWIAPQSWSHTWIFMGTL